MGAPARMPIPSSFNPQMGAALLAARERAKRVMVGPTILGGLWREPTPDDGPLKAEARQAIRAALGPLAEGVTEKMVDIAMQRWAWWYDEAHKEHAKAPRLTRYDQKRQRLQTVARAADALLRALQQVDRHGEGWALLVRMGEPPPGSTLLGYDYAAEWQRLREVATAISELERLAREATPEPKPQKRGNPGKKHLKAGLRDLAVIYALATGNSPGRDDEERDGNPGPFHRFVNEVMPRVWGEKVGSMSGLIRAVCEAFPNAPG